jgi:hypothetical protein
VPQRLCGSAWLITLPRPVTRGGCRRYETESGRSKRNVCGKGPETLEARVESDRAYRLEVLESREKATRYMGGLLLGL